MLPRYSDWVFTIPKHIRKRMGLIGITKGSIITDALGQADNGTQVQLDAALAVWERKRIAGYKKMREQGWFIADFLLVPTCFKKDPYLKHLC